MKRNSILITTIGIILIGIGLLVGFIISSNSKSKGLKKDISTINDNYEKFEEHMQIFNGEREIISNISNNYYIDELEYNYSTWISSFNDYLKSINDINNYKEILINLCIDKTYKDSNVQSKCQSMTMNYETAINYFVKDVNNFNKFVTEYNKNTTDTKELFNLNNYNYIDINDDGKYLGK